jgi:hypothetical protein
MNSGGGVTLFPTFFMLKMGFILKILRGEKLYNKITFRILFLSPFKTYNSIPKGHILVKVVFC